MVPLQYTIFMILSPTAAVCSLLVGIHSWSQRENKGALTFALFMWLACGWVACDTFELLTETPQATFFWARLSFLFVGAIPVTWFIFINQFYGKGYWFTPGTIILLLLIPAITNIFIWVRPYYHLIWSEFEIVQAGRFLSMVVHEYGTGFWVFVLYSYLLIGYGAFVLVRYTFRSSVIYRRQSVWMLIGALFPITLNLLYVFRVLPGVTEDYTTVSFAFAGLAIAAGIYRYQLFSFSPLARDFIIDQIQDGFLITNRKDMVIDINPAAVKIFNTTPFAVLGKPINQLLPEWEKLHVERDSPTQFTTKLKDEQQLRHYDVNITDLSLIRRGLSGSIVILRDITEREKLLEEVQQLAITDDLTQVCNRRHFFSLADQALKLAIRYHRPLSVFMLDIDHFKEINDRYGHGIGDKVLQGFVGVAVNTLRGSDTLARLGGEEFIVLLPETDHKEALIAAERLRKHVSSTPMTSQNGEIIITISVGIASISLITSPYSVEKLVDRADRALYQAKQAGRNQAAVYNPSAAGVEYLNPDDPSG